MPTLEERKAARDALEKGLTDIRARWEAGEDPDVLVAELHPLVRACPIIVTVKLIESSAAISRWWVNQVSVRLAKLQQAGQLE